MTKFALTAIAATTALLLSTTAVKAEDQNSAIKDQIALITSHCQTSKCLVKETKSGGMQLIAVIGDTRYQYTYTKTGKESVTMSTATPSMQKKIEAQE